MADETPTPPPSRRRALIQLGGAALAAAAIVVLFVLPAEFGKDLTGFGKLTGLTRLAAPRPDKPAAASTAKSAAPAPLLRTYATRWRTDQIDIPLTSAEDLGAEIETKVKMKKGATLIYSWTVTGLTNPEEFYFDMHSQSDPMPKVVVISHEARIGTGGNGALVAPFDGIHGWYLQNQSVGPVVVHLKLAGFYERMTPSDIRLYNEQAATMEGAFGPPS
jgi:hypothetical protein